MTRRDWWIGLGLVVAAILCHALVPRYEYHHPGLGYAGNVASGAFYTEGVKWPGTLWIRVDRWTGRAQLVAVVGDGLSVVSTARQEPP